MAATPRRYVPGPRPNPNNPPPNNHIPGSGMFNNPGHHPGNGQHNNSGGGTQGGNGGKKSRRHPSGPLYKQARNDVTLANRPYLDAIHQAQIQARQQYAQDAARVKSIYGALGSQLAPLSAQYQQGTAGISSDLQSQIKALTGMIGSNVQGVPQSEIGAGANVMGAIGGGTLSQLAGDQSRNLAYNTSAQRQGGIEQMTAGRNYLQDFQNLRDQMQARRLDTRSSMASQIMQRLNQLKDQQFQQMMAQKQFGLSAADQRRLMMATNASIAQGNRANNQSDADRRAWAIAHGYIKG